MTMTNIIKIILVLFSLIFGAALLLGFPKSSGEIALHLIGTVLCVGFYGVISAIEAEK